MCLDDKKDVLLSSFNTAIIDAKPNSCEDDADSNMALVHMNILDHASVRPIEGIWCRGVVPTVVFVQDNNLEEFGDNIGDEHIAFEADLDDGDAASDVEAGRIHRLHEEPITYFQLRRICTDAFVCHTSLS
ncbi:hypothetical protein ZWY2020_003178 [Hordeum vulgare]|nr:hypothetical protein ZWY2020_003178 [Hordeum vulgare]